MSLGLIVRFEEITRCPPEIQDVLISILSEKLMMVPELADDGRVLLAQPGFNIVATANIRDRGVHEMSSALKRRFNFETVHPIGGWLKRSRWSPSSAANSCRKRGPTWRFAATWWKCS